MFFSRRSIPAFLFQFACPFHHSLLSVLATCLCHRSPRRRRQNVVRLDSDENASTAVIILTDLYKMFPLQLAAQSRAFIDTSVERFRSLQPLVAHAFGGDRVCGK